jgi:hypothetical protein
MKGQQVAASELVHKIVGNLGRGWQVDAGALQNSGEYRGLASSPDGMRLFFISRTEKLDPLMEHICPPLGWLRVDGRLHFSDEDLSAKLSIMLRESLSPEEMANEIMVRLSPIYRDFLCAMEKHNLQNQPSEERPPGPVQVSQKTMTEQQAASSFVCCMLEESARSWPSTYEALKASLGNKFVLEDERVLTELAVTWNWQKIRDDFNLIPSPEIKDEDIPF